MRKLVLTLISVSVVSAGCTTATNIDEYRSSDRNILLGETEKVVVLGRRHAGEYETEAGFISCIGNKLSNGNIVSVYSEEGFIDQLYPWFEPRTAPLKLARMKQILQEPMISARIRSLDIRYMIWVDGKTEVTDRKGAMSCAIGPGGGGCFGFAAWDKVSEFEAIIWDLEDINEEGRVRVDARGSSYVISILVPVPFLARVQAQACDGLGKQLSSFFSKTVTAE